jgi:MarR family transcriptional regulator, organic hydroperoxide resistance regulator
LRERVIEITQERMMSEIYPSKLILPNSYALWRYLDHARYMVFRLREKELAQSGLTPEQAQILDIIYTAGGFTTINFIVKSTQRQHNSISTLIARMSRQGLVKKTRTRRDKRAYRITITEKGSTAYLSLTNHSIEQAFSDLKDDEKRALFYNLERLLAHLYELAGISFSTRLNDEENNQHA